MTELEGADPDDTVASTTPTELKERIDSDEEVFILDARSEGEFEEKYGTESQPATAAES